jgi:hypothetical protein
MRQKFGRRFAFLLGIAAIAVPGWAGNVPADKTPELKLPPLPPITALTVEPAELTLDDGLDSRRVLVWGEVDGQSPVDLTARATFYCDSPVVEIGEDGFVIPKQSGEATVSVCAAGRETTLKVTVTNATKPPIRFVRNIEPVLSKIGCNAGTCHGSAKGKNGFKLSLRGYDPAFDYQALINDESGRRFNRVEVDQSLMLLKPTAEVPHEGRQVIKPGSRYYQLLRQWILEGTKFEDPECNRPTGLVVLPDQIQMDLPGRTQQMRVVAEYEDGASREVTREVVFSINNIDVAAVSKDGLVTGLRRGEAAVLIRYEGLYATKDVTVMGDRTGWAWNQPPEYNFIDHDINAKLQRMKILPSQLCTDAEFIRRASFDLTGMPPTAERTRAFLTDTTDSQAKRNKLIDELISSPAYVDYWANKWADLLQCSSATLGQKGVWVFYNWIRQSLKDNKPYDQFVRELLLAEGSAYQDPPANYYRVLREPGKIAEDVTQTFLGVRFNCNKCHDHPFEKWTQNQYYEFGAYFARVAIKRGTLGKDVIRTFTGDNTTVAGEEIVYPNYEGGEVKYLRTGLDAKPKVPFGQAPAIDPAGDRREALVAWLTAKDNPLFAKAMANRVWSYFFGRGIIDPVDDIRSSNPPSNPALLDALTKYFVENRLDVRQLMRTICQSRTYQLSIVKNRWNEDDQINFAHANPRRLSAEQLVDAVAVCTGTKEKFKGLPPGLRAVDIPDGSVPGDDFLALFGRPQRQSACECERTSNVSLSHAMNLINGSMIGNAVDASGNAIAKLVDHEPNNQKVVEEIYYRVLSRPPSAKELASVDFSASSTRLEAAQDLTWALFNSPSFLFNR